MEIKTTDEVHEFWEDCDSKHSDNEEYYDSHDLAEDWNKKWVKVDNIKQKLKSFKDLFELGSNESSALASILESLNK